MIVLILLRIARQAPAQAQTSDQVSSLFRPGRWAPRVGTWSSPAWGQGPKGEQDPRGLAGSGRSGGDATEQDPAGIRAQDRAPRHRRAPPAGMPVAPAPSADGEPLQERGGGLCHRSRSVYNGLFVEKFHQSFSLDN
uniref:Uncharacterized protein n=1 Tax=Rhinopithecus bieti TaxID=61621 RepID=A0A2K6LHS8_RHIBE